MKLKCTIGSLSCDGVLAEAGDIFDIDSEVGAGLVKSRYAIEIDQPETNKPSTKQKSRK